MTASTTPPNANPIRSALIAMAICLVLWLGAVAWENPHAQVPVMSKLVCAVKGGAWYAGDGFGNPAGCYEAGP